MGLGRFKNGKFDLIVVANFLMNSDDWTAWERAHKKASEILYNASEGQMQFGKLFVCDDSIGLDIADFILHDSGDPSYTSGSFGIAGSAVHLMPYVRTSGPLSILHEMGHHVWGLGEEYSTPLSFDDIDKTNPAPDKKTIPIQGSTWAINELATLGAQAILPFATSSFERRNVISNTSTTVTVNSDYPELPTNSTADQVAYQFPAECSTPTSNYCMMDKSRGNAGTFDGSGNWIPATNPVTEYCTASNHDPDHDTQQDDTYGKSCWEVILDRPGFSSLSGPDPASSGPTVGWTTPDWIVLDKQPRFVLVLDHSFSMAQGTKMDDTKYGAIYWLEYCKESTDKLAIVWYNESVDTILDLTDISSLPDLNSEIAAINSLTPNGNTNIRDGLYESLDQIESISTRAATQVTLLLTDGIHNRPIGSSATEVIPQFQESGVRIYGIGVGNQFEVDMDTVDTLASETGGRSFAVGSSAQSAVQTAMIEINAEIRGGIITTQPITFPDSHNGETKKYRRRTCKEIIELIGIDLSNLIEELKSYQGPLRNRLVLVPVFVEEQCDRVSFSLIRPKNTNIQLCLINPDGKLVNMESGDIHHIISGAPHEFAIVEKPMTGLWYILAFRSQPGPNVSARALAGGENRHLQVFGNVVKNPPFGSPVKIWASARWRDELSNLRVTATVISPDGTRDLVILSDNKYNEPNTGNYEGYATPKKEGRYRVIIRIENKGNAIISNPYKLIMHTEKPSMSIKSIAPRFIRSLVCYFDYGRRQKVRDGDVKRENKKAQKF